MAFVAIATSVGTAVGLSGTAAILGGGALIGAGAGGLYSAITGDGDILNSMLTGGLIGGAGAFGLQAMGVGAAPAITSPTALASAPISTALTPTANVLTATPAATSFGMTSGAGATGGLSATASGATKGLLAPSIAASNTALGLPAAVTPIINPAIAGATKTAAGMTGKEMLGYGLVGTSALQLLGGKKGAQPPASATYPGDIRPYEYSASPNSDTGEYLYPTTEYDMAGNPMLDTSERSYFDQSFKPLQVYKAGTANPNPVTAAQGGLMGAYPMEKYGNTIPNTEVYGMGMAEGGEVSMDADRQKLIMKNIKGASTEQLEQILGSMNQQEFLMKNMPNYAQAMRPSISGMVEGAQYGDRMAKSYGGQPRDINVMPTNIDPQSGMYGGIASIGRQIDPNTRVNAMANIQRTPYDRNAMDSVRRLGVGVDRQIGKDTNLSAFYEQDPKGRDRMGGARLTQRFEHGGQVKRMFGGGMSALMPALMAQNPQMFAPKYEYDPANQRYNNMTPQGSAPSGLAGLFNSLGLGAAQDAPKRYTYNPQEQSYTAMAAGGQTSSLGSYSDGGRMLKGPGDGMSDHIPGIIGGKQPARLADGEFVVPADVVSHLGNGSTDAGAKRLYAMMDTVRKARTGTKKQGKQIKADKYLPK
jgi:hypothetical protein